MGHTRRRALRLESPRCGRALGAANVCKYILPRGKQIAHLFLGYNDYYGVCYVAVVVALVVAFVVDVAVGIVVVIVNVLLLVVEQMKIVVVWGYCQMLTYVVDFLLLLLLVVVGEDGLQPRAREMSGLQCA